MGLLVSMLAVTAVQSVVTSTLLQCYLAEWVMPFPGALGTSERGPARECTSP